MISESLKTIGERTVRIFSYWCEKCDRRKYTVDEPTARASECKKCAKTRKATEGMVPLFPVGE